MPPVTIRPSFRVVNMAKTGPEWAFSIILEATGPFHTITEPVAIPVKVISSVPNAKDKHVPT